MLNPAHRAAIDRNAALAVDTILDKARGFSHLGPADAIEQLSRSLVSGPTGREGFAATLAALAVHVVTEQAGEEHEPAWHEFHDGPWNGQRIEIEPSPDGYEHLVAHRPEPGLGEWVPADARPGTGRYVRTGSYGETTVMTWTAGSKA
jgi:hypothetical protein